jgi:4'-phosphopantetheinyl transferase
VTHPVTVRWLHLDDLDDPDDPDDLGDLDGDPTSVPLSPGERARLAALRVPADRRRFLGARSLLRAAVAEVTGADPRHVRLHQRCERCGGPHGRPQVQVGTDPGPHVSVAHAGALAVVAVGRSPVGVDVEPVAPVLRSTQPPWPVGPPAPAGVSDLRTWVRREAVLKAVGLGVDVDPDPVRLGPPDAPPRLVAWSGPGRRPRVHLADLDTAPGHLVTVATVGRRRPVDAAPLRVSGW